MCGQRSEYLPLEEQKPLNPLRGIFANTDTNNHSSCMTKRILPFNYLKVIDLNRIDMPDINMMH